MASYTKLPTQRAPMANFTHSLAQLEQQQEATERLVAQHQMSIDLLLREHRRTLAEHRQILEGAHEHAHQERALSSVPAKWEAPPSARSLPRSHSDASDSDKSSSGNSDVELSTDGQARSLAKNSQPTKSVAAHNCVQRALLPIVHSAPFQATIMSLVITSAVFLAIDVDMTVKEVLTGKLNPWKPYVDWSQMLIFVGFCIELLLRVLAEQWDFLFGIHWRWNMFETVVLLTNISDVVSHHQAGGMSALRLVRIVRIFRAVRIIRIFQFLRQMRLMIFTIIASFSAFVWALMLMLLLVFISAIYLEDVALEYMTAHKRARHDPIMQGFSENWAGMNDAVFSLILSISGGQDWGDIAEPFVTMSLMHRIIYTTIILFMLFGFFNVVVGIFVNETGGVESLDPELVLQTSARKSEALSNSLRMIFDEIDTNENGVLSSQELREALKNERISAHLNHFEIDTRPDEIDTFMEVMDSNKDGVINASEFISGCLRLQGTAKPMDLAILNLKVNEMHRKIDLLVGSASHRR